MSNLSASRIDEKIADTAWAEVDLDKLRGNLSTIRNYCGNKVDIMAVVKADGYGHGAELVARAALQSGASALAVATVHEGVHLRKNGIIAPILVLGVYSGDQVPAFYEYGLTASVMSYRDADQLAAYGAAAGLTCKIHLRIDMTGGAIGVPYEQALPLIESVMRMESLHLEGVYTHLASAYTDNPASGKFDLRAFQLLVDDLGRRGIQIPIIHAASSPAILTMPDARFNLVRAGILMYGLPVMDNQPAIAVKPIMQIKARITSIRTIESGARFGYGGKYEAAAPVRAAILPIGYGDCPFLHLMKGGEALVKGRRAPYLGQVYMDHLMIDVTHIADAAIGDEVILLGEQGDQTIGALELAERSGVGSLNCDFVCLLGQRLRRIYTGERG